MAGSYTGFLKRKGSGFPHVSRAPVSSVAAELAAQAGPRKAFHVPQRSSPASSVVGRRAFVCGVQPTLGSDLNSG